MTIQLSNSTKGKNESRRSLYSVEALSSSLLSQVNDVTLNDPSKVTGPRTKKNDTVSI